MRSNTWPTLKTWSCTQTESMPSSSACTARSTSGWGSSNPQLLSSENPSFIALGRARRDLGAPRLHGRPQRRELFDPPGGPRQDPVDLGALRRSQVELGARVVRVYFGRSARPDQRRADRGIAEHPRECDL